MTFGPWRAENTPYRSKNVLQIIDLTINNTVVCPAVARIVEKIIQD